MKRRRPPLVEVVWLDAVTHNQTVKVRHDEEIPTAVLAVAQLATRTTSGYLLHQDPERTILAHTYDSEPEEDDAADLTVIPTGWVKETKHVRKPRTKKAKEPPCPS